jgi:hypothetical protein
LNNARALVLHLLCDRVSIQVMSAPENRSAKTIEDLICLACSRVVDVRRRSHDASGSRAARLLGLSELRVRVCDEHCFY